MPEISFCYDGGPAVSAQNETKMAETPLVQEQEEESENTEENSTPYCNQPVYREISHTNQWMNERDEER